MKMKYQQLTDFLLPKLPERYRANFYSWLEDGKLIDLGKQVTATGIEIAQIQYRAVLFFNELPFAQINPAQLMAWVQIWLSEHDEMRARIDDFETPFELELIDDQTADLTFTIDFRDSLTAMADPNGELEVSGQRFRLDNIEIYTAE